MAQFLLLALHLTRERRLGREGERSVLRMLGIAGREEVRCSRTSGRTELGVEMRTNSREKQEKVKIILISFLYISHFAPRSY